MAKDADLEIGLRWQGESFEVNLGYDDPDDIADQETPARTPVLIDVDALGRLADDVDAYGEALAVLLFGQDTDIRSFYGKARAVAENKDVAVHLRIYVDPEAPPRFSSVRWETLRDPEDGHPIATKRNLILSRHLKSSDWRSIT